MPKILPPIKLSRTGLPPEFMIDDDDGTISINTDRLPQAVVSRLRKASGRPDCGYYTRSFPKYPTARFVAVDEVAAAIEDARSLSPSRQLDDLLYRLRYYRRQMERIRLAGSPDM